jgi:hypothetical protein
LSDALIAADGAVFTNQTDLKLLIAYYGTGGVDAINITSANLILQQP